MSCQIAQTTSKQMSKRDSLRPYMDVIDNMLIQMVFIDHCQILIVPSHQIIKQSD